MRAPLALLAALATLAPIAGATTIAFDLERKSSDAGDDGCDFSTTGYEREDSESADVSVDDVSASAFVKRTCGASSNNSGAERHSGIEAGVRVLAHAVELLYGGSTGFHETGNTDSCYAALLLQGHGFPESQELPCAPGSPLPPMAFLP